MSKRFNECIIKEGNVKDKNSLIARIDTIIREKFIEVGSSTNLSSILDIEDALILETYNKITENLKGINKTLSCNTNSGSEEFNLCSLHKDSQTTIPFFSFIKSQAQGKEDKTVIYAKRYIGNKINRYNSRMKSFAEIIESRKHNRAKTAANNIVDTLLDFEIIKKGEDGTKNKIQFFRDFVTFLLLKYKIKYGIMEVKNVENCSLEDSIVNCNNNKDELRRCNHIFTYTKLISKHFPYLWQKEFEDKRTNAVEIDTNPFYNDNVAECKMSNKNCKFKSKDVISNIFCESSKIKDNNYVAFLVEILSFLKRSYTFYLLDEYDNAFKDYSEIETIIEKVKKHRNAEKDNIGNPVKDLYNNFISIYRLICLFRKGELYRKDYSHVNAIQYYCNCEESFKLPDVTIVSSKNDLSECGIRFLNYISKAKTYFEMGELQRSLKWLLKAIFLAIRIYQKPKDEKEQENFNKKIKSIDGEGGKIDKLGQNFLDKFIDKETVRKTTEEILGEIRSYEIDNEFYRFIISDITNRIGILLFIINITTNDENGKHELALRYVNYSLDNDNTNLLAHLNIQFISAGTQSPGVNRKHASGYLNCTGNIFEKWTKKYIYHVLKRSNCNSKNRTLDCDEISKKISHNLLRNFFSFTDNLVTKTSQLYRYLMKERKIGEIGNKTMAFIFFV